MNCIFAESPEFRVHIRNLLYEYSINHYTTNYAEFTEDLVGEFVESLVKIPLIDRYSLTRLPDPFDVFCQINSFSTLTPYDETPQTTQDAISYLKSVMKSAVGASRTEKVIYHDHYGPRCPGDAFMPALTRKARQNTPRPGKLNNTIPKTHLSLLTSQKIKTLEVEPVQEKTLIVEDLLDIKCQVKPEELPTVQSLLRSTANMMRTQKDYTNKYLRPEYLAEISLPQPYDVEEEFMPMFPRDRVHTAGMKMAPKLCAEGFESFDEIPLLATIQKEVDLDDLQVDPSRENLIIVDGWETIKSSPPSTPHSAQSDEDQIDQLCLPSTPDTDPPLISDFLDAKMEPVLMPRSRKIGGSEGIGPHILAGKSFRSFLQPLLSPIALTSERTKKADENAENLRRASPVPSSMVGEADPENDPEPGPETEKDLDDEIKAVYAHRSLDDFIRAEAIDDKPNSMMDVPDLPGPNIHLPNAMHVPQSMTEYLVPKRGDNQKPVKKSSLPAHQFLSKAKGISSLYTSLSWVMFKTDKQLPSNEEAVGVHKLLDDCGSSGCSDTDLAKINALLESVSIQDEERLPRWDDHGADCFQYQLSDDFQILQTREERWRLAKLEGRVADLPDEDEDVIEEVLNEPTGDDEISDDEPEERLESDRPVKRSRLDSGLAVDPIQSTECSSQPALNAVLNPGEEPEPPAPDDDVELLVRDVDFERALSVNVDGPATHEENIANAQPESFEALEDDIDMHYDDFSDDFEEDKENWPPSTPSLPVATDDISSDYHTPEHMRHYLAAQYDFDESQSQCYPGITEEPVAGGEEGSFQLLSFGSKQPDHGTQFVEDAVANETLNPLDIAEDDGLSYVSEVNEPMEAAPQVEEHAKTQASGLLLEPNIASHSLGTFAFAQLRARRLSAPAAVAPPPPAESIREPTFEPTAPEATREDIVDQNTLQLPCIINAASSMHRYMAALEFIQKHALVRALASEECAVELAERPSLVGVDLILDPYSAIIVFSLFALPARCESYIERVAEQSWRYSKLLIIFEAYPEHLSKRSSTKYGVDSSAAASELRAYTPPIIKAIKKFRRDLNIADACGSKDPKSKVSYAFADTVNEAALLIRYFGDQVEAEDETRGALWGEREWLLADNVEDEEARLAGIVGMNQFKASIILCQVSLQDYVDMSAEERMDAFAPYVGVDTMESCNTFLAARLQQIYSDAEDGDNIEQNPQEIS